MRLSKLQLYPAIAIDLNSLCVESEKVVVFAFHSRVVPPPQNLSLLGGC